MSSSRNLLDITTIDPRSKKETMFERLNLLKKNEIVKIHLSQLQFNIKLYLFYYINIFIIFKRKIIIIPIR